MSKDKSNKPGAITDPFGASSTSIPGAAPTSIPGAAPTAIPGAAPTAIPGAAPTAIPGAATTQVPGASTTAVPGVGSTAVPGAGHRPSAPGSVSDIPVLDEYTINGIRYTVDKAASAKTLSKKSGEARIFVVENGGHKFVLKIYIPNHGPNHAVLDKVQQGKGGFLVNLRDHGKWTDPVRGLMLDYEIMDYAPYGSLADLTLRGDEKQFKEVAMRMAFALKQCHSMGIIHRDIKPENFLFTNAQHTEFVVIDFGIAREMKGFSPVKVDAAKSSYFVSPEGASSSTDRTTYVGHATDYYSMGMTLLALWMGTANFYKMFPANDLAELDRLKRNNNVIGKLRAKLGISDHLASLLERLLEVSDESRAGFNEVQRWYKGETLKTGSAAEAETVKDTGFRVVFNDVKNQVARSTAELAAMMMADVEFAKKFLYKGLAKSALQGIRPTLAIEIDDITQTKYPGLADQDAGVFAAALLLDPSMPFIGINGARCTTTAEIANNLWANRSKYADQLKAKNTRLWVYLTMRGDSTLKEYPATYRTAIAASGVAGVYELAKALDPSLPFYTLGNTELRDAKKLAQELWKNRDKYAQTLGDYHAMPYTFLRHLGANGKNVAAKFYQKFNSDAHTEEAKRENLDHLYALCLTLDPSFPLFSDKGKALSTEEEIAAEFEETWIMQTDQLKRKTHPVWTYLRTKGGQWAKIADDYPTLIANSNNSYIWDVYYRLGTTPRPFSMQYADDNKWYYMYSLEEICEAYRKHGLTPLSIECVSRVHFSTWLMRNKCAADAKLAPVLEKLVKEAGSNASKRGWYFLYTLMPDKGINLCDKSKLPAAYTGPELGEAIQRELTIDRSFMPDGSWLTTQMQSSSFRTSQFAQYLEARKMGAYIDGIAKIMDIKANSAAHPSAPYDQMIAHWKVVPYLGAKPSFFTPASKKNVYTIWEVQNIPPLERSGLAHNQSFLAFLTLLFHEDPKGSFSFSKLRSYYEMLAIHFPDHAGVKRARPISSQIRAARDARDKAWRSLKNMRKYSLIFCLIPLICVLVWMMAVSFGEGASTLAVAFEAIGKVIAVLLAIVGVIAGFSGGWVGAIVGGLAGYWIPIWIFALLSSIAPFVLALLLGGAAVWCTMVMFQESKDTHIPDNNKLKQLISQGEMLEVCTAFGTVGRTFGSSSPNPIGVFEASERLAATRKKSTVKAMWGMIGLAVITLAIGISLVGTYEKVERGEITGNAHIIPDIENVQGHYEGSFHERHATMDITHTEGDLFVGSVTIDYSTPMTQSISGSYNEKTGRLFFYGDGKNAIKYTGELYSINDNTEPVYEGEYTNSEKGTRHDFKFSKTADEPWVTTSSASATSSSGKTTSGTSASTTPAATTSTSTTATASNPIGRWTSTSSGLRYKWLKNGDGGSKPVSSSTVVVYYTGKLADGTVFDQTTAGSPASFQVGSVIPGFAEGLKLMSRGSKIRLEIPGKLAYGSQGVPSAGIEPNATLTFDVELVDFK